MQRFLLVQSEDGRSALTSGCAFHDIHYRDKQVATQRMRYVTVLQSNTLFVGQDNVRKMIDPVDPLSLGAATESRMYYERTDTLA